MLARLVVHLQSNYSHLQKGLQQSGGLVRSFVGGFRGMVGGIAGLAAVGGTIAGVTHQLSELDKVAKLSSSTGFGSATLMGLGFAAEQSGASVETMQRSMKKFSISMGQLAQGTGPGVAALEQLGLSYGNLAALSPDEQLLSVAEAMKGLPNEAARNAAAMQLFGESGVELTNMLATGRDGLQAFIAEADGLGLGFDREELAKVEAANDAINRIKRTVGAAFGQLAVAVAPMLDTAATGINKVMQSMGGLNGIVQTAGEWWTWLQNKIAQGITIGMTVAEFGMTNWQAIAELALTSVGLGFVELFGTVQHFFTGQLPALLSWFGQNWRDVFMTAFDFVTTVFINLGTNIRSAMKAIWDYIASGGTKSLQIAWTPLTDGFVNSIKKLPDVPERIIGPIEAGMRQRVDQLGSSLSGDFSGMMNDRLAELDRVQRTAPAVTAPAAAGGTAGGGGDGSGETGTGTPGSVGDQKVGALAKGSSEAFSAIFAAMRSRQDAPQLQLAKETAVATKKSAASTERIARKLDEGAQIAIIESFA